jgi:hypothetical protein
MGGGLKINHVDIERRFSAGLERESNYGFFYLY